MFVENWFLTDDFDWALDLYWDLNSLLHRHNILDVDNPINYSVHVDLHRVLFNNFHYLIHINFRVEFRLYFNNLLDLHVFDLINNF